MKAVLLMLLIVLPCEAARNPFVPLSDPCVSPFQHWVLRGVAHTAGEPSLALLSTPEGWLRLRHNARPLPGWQVAEIAQGHVLLRGPHECAPVILRGPEK